MTDTIQVAFPKVDEGSTALVLPPPADTPANAGLATIIESAGSPVAAQQTLVCKNLLMGDTFKQAEQEAQQLYPEMLNDTAVFMTYGTQALEGVNTLIDRLLHEVEPVKIPELTELMKSLNDNMRGVKRDYDVSNPEVREKFEKWSKGFWGFIHRGKTFIEMLMEGVTSIERQIDNVGKKLKDKQNQLTRNVLYYDELYDENELEILKLIYTIGVMELIRDLATEEAAAIKLGDANLGDRAGEKKASLAQFSNNMEIKIAEYKGRLFVAWATSPQVRMMRTLNVSLAERINELICVAIPTMKATIVQWRLLVETQQGAEMTNVVVEATNEWLRAYAATSEVAVPMIADAVQTPTLNPETIGAMADSIAGQAEGIINAIQAGAKRRAEMDHAIVQAHGVITAAAGEVSEAVIEEVVNAANKPLEIATSVSA